MNEQLVKTLRGLPARRRLDKITISEGLKLMGIKPVAQELRYPQRPGPGNSFTAAIGTKSTLSFRIGKLNEWELADLFEVAHKVWKKGCKIIKTQFIENHELASKWNELWNRIKQLFKQRGVEMA